MRICGISFQGLVLIVLSVSMVFPVSAGSTKEHKKKLLEKLRAALNASEAGIVAGPASVESVAEPLNETISSVPEKNVASISSEVVTSGSDQTVGGTEVDASKVEEVTEIAIQESNNYIANLRSVLKRILELLGFRKEKKKDGRTNRMLNLDSNDVEHVPKYRDEVRTTVGAVMGQEDCVHKVACKAGSYLKTIKGKQIIFAILESFSPNTWRDTLKVVKKSALLNEHCEFKCLED